MSVLQEFVFVMMYVLGMQVTLGGECDRRVVKWRECDVLLFCAVCVEAEGKRRVATVFNSQNKMKMVLSHRHVVSLPLDFLHFCPKLCSSVHAQRSFVPLSPLSGIDCLFVTDTNHQEEQHKIFIRNSKLTDDNDTNRTAVS